MGALVTVLFAVVAWEIQQVIGRLDSAEKHMQLLTCRIIVLEQKTGVDSGSCK